MSRCGTLTVGLGEADWVTLDRAFLANSDITLQHLPTSSVGPASLSSTTLPSHSSAAKFVAKRLYSKKRQVAVLDQGRPQLQDRNPKKQKGMSLESKILLGLADPEDADSAKDKERRRKKSLLLQAEGQRKSGMSSFSARVVARAPRAALTVSCSSHSDCRATTCLGSERVQTCGQLCRLELLRMSSAPLDIEVKIAVFTRRHGTRAV